MRVLAAALPKPVFLALFSKVEILEFGGERVTGRPARQDDDRIDALAGFLDQSVERVTNAVGVVAGAARQDIRAAHADQRVVARIAVDDVVLVAAGQTVADSAAIDGDGVDTIGPAGEGDAAEVEICQRIDDDLVGPGGGPNKPLLDSAAVGLVVHNQVQGGPPTDRMEPSSRTRLSRCAAKPPVSSWPVIRTRPWGASVEK